MKRITITLASTLIVLANCSQVSPTEPSTDPSSAGPAPSSEPATSEAPSAEPTTDAPAASTEAAGACSTADLEIAVGEPEGAAGSIYLPLTFTATSPCVLDGSPEVTFVDAQRTQIGEPAEPEREGEPITLAPGETATASLRVGQADIYDGCKPVESAHMLVTPPGGTDPVELPAQFSICTGMDNTSIGPIEGPTTP